jgi:hypothetical protein
LHAAVEDVTSRNVAVGVDEYRMQHRKVLRFGILGVEFHAEYRMCCVIREPYPPEISLWDIVDHIASHEDEETNLLRKMMVRAQEAKFMWYVANLSAKHFRAY